MKLNEVLKGIDVDFIKGLDDIEIVDIAYDSRKVREGYVFVCIEGYKTDGHEYIDAAIKNGASAIIIQKDIACFSDITVVKVSDSRYVLSHISNIFFDYPSKKLNITGITGTKGKTTTTYMIKSILEHNNRKVGLIGTIANSIGDKVLKADRTTPESYDLQELFAKMLEKNANDVVMEVSSHALDLHRVSCTDFDIGIFTNLSRDHLDFHGTFDNYILAKVKLFKMCKKGLVNIDNDYSQKVIEEALCPVLTYGIENAADICAKDIKLNSDSVEFTVVSSWVQDRIFVNIPGKFTVYNALAAIGACRYMNVPIDVIKKGLKNIQVPGRAEVINTNKDFTIIIDYAHTPDSLEYILTTVKGFAAQRVVSVFGCGGDRDKTKRPIMGEISGRIADFTIITSDNPRTEDPKQIIEDIETGIKNLNSAYITIEDRRKAIKYSIENAKPKDIIVLSGKGHETYQIFKDKTIHFDEREVVAEILEQLNNE